MNLLTHSPENTPSIRTGKPRIRISKSGVFSLNKAAVRHLDLDTTKAVKLLFHQDGDSKKDWFIEKHELGFETREVKGAVLFNSIGLSTKIAKSCDFQLPVSLLIGGFQDFEGVKVALIITASGKKTTSFDTM